LLDRFFFEYNWIERTHASPIPSGQSGGGWGGVVCVLWGGVLVFGGGGGGGGGCFVGSVGWGGHRAAAKLLQSSLGRTAELKHNKRGEKRES